MTRRPERSESRPRFDDTDDEWLYEPIDAQAASPLCLHSLLDLPLTPNTNSLVFRI